MLFAIRLFLLLESLRNYLGYICRHTTNICVHTYLSLFLYISICTHIKLNFSSYQCLSLQFSSTSFIVAFPFAFLYFTGPTMRSLALQQLTVYLLTCLTPIYLQSRFRIVTLYLNKEHNYQIEHSVYAQFHFSFSFTVFSLNAVFSVNSNNFFLICILCSKIMSYIFYTVRLICHSLHCILGYQAPDRFFICIY